MGRYITNPSYPYSLDLHKDYSIVQEERFISKQRQPRVDGKIAEAFALYKLTSFGLDPHAAGGQLPYDIWVDFKGWIVRVQIKATRNLALNRNGYTFDLRKRDPSGRRGYNKADCDLFGLVCLKEEKIMFRTDCFGKSTQGVTEDEFDRLDEEASWLEAATEILGQRDV